MSAAALLLAAVVSAAGEGVPDDVVARAREVVARVLEGVDGEVRVRLHGTRAAMEEAVRALEPRAPVDFAAYFHYGSRTIHAWPVEPPGLFVGALVHEAQHAKGLLSQRDYRARPAWRIEGEADRDAVRFLEGVDRTWELLLESRVARARERGLFAAEDVFRRIDPLALPPDQRATWYAQAYAMFRGDAPPPPWVLWAGIAEPLPDGGYRLAPGALLVRAAPGPLAVEVVPEEGAVVELVFGFRSEERRAKVVFRERGGVRAAWLEGGVWTEDPVHPAPPLARGRPVRLAIERGAVLVDGEPVLHVQAPPGRVGVAVRGGAALVRPSS